MKAKFTDLNASNGRNYYGEKELIAQYTVVAFSKGEFVDVVNVKCYMGRSSNSRVVYASIWVNAPKKKAYMAGTGKAGGYGYHKESAAIGEAIHSAGIELYGDVYGRDDTKKTRADIGGCGESAIRDALGAIARAAGYHKFTIV
jgi:hypothetical protein